MQNIKQKANANKDNTKHEKLNRATNEPLRIFINNPHLS